MIGDIFNVAFYQPLYNGLVFLIYIFPFGDVGFAIIVLTIVVKFIIFPFTHKSVKTQAKLREIEPEVKKIKKQHEKDKQQQAQKMMELYRKHGVNPFSGCTLILVQLPIILALYWVFWKGLTNGIDMSNLYTITPIPDTINFNFLGFIDIMGKSMIFALAAGITQHFQMRLSMPQIMEKEPKPAHDSTTSFKSEFAKSFRIQMKYGFPVLVFFIAYTISSAVAIYWTTSNLFSITHELVVKKKAKAIQINANEKTS